MDLATQGILGGVVAQSLYQKSLGRKATLVGFLVGLVPDLDIILGYMGGKMWEFQYHRGFSHSLFFAPLISPWLGKLFARWDKKNLSPGKESQWQWLVFWCLLTHPLLDLFTLYGTQLLAPFSSHRFSLSAISVVDPLYSLPLIAFLILGWAFWKKPWARIFPTSGLLLTTAYLFYSLVQQDIALQQARTYLERENISYYRLDVYTTVLQVYIRRIVVHTEDKILIGYLSTRCPHEKIFWYQVPKTSSSLVVKALETREGQMFKWFANNQLISLVEEKGNEKKLYVYDGRFGFPPHAHHGIWGFTMKFDAQEIPLEGPEWFSIRPGISWKKIKNIFKASYEGCHLLWE